MDNLCCEASISQTAPRWEHCSRVTSKTAQWGAGPTIPTLSIPFLNALVTHTADHLSDPPSPLCPNSHPSAFNSPLKSEPPNARPHPHPDKGRARPSLSPWPVTSLCRCCGSSRTCEGWAVLSGLPGSHRCECLAISEATRAGVATACLRELSVGLHTAQVNPGLPGGASVLAGRDQTSPWWSLVQLWDGRTVWHSLQRDQLEDAALREVSQARGQRLLGFITSGTKRSQVMGVEGGLVGLGWGGGRAVLFWGQ